VIFGQFGEQEIADPEPGSKCAAMLIVRAVEYLPAVVLRAIHETTVPPAPPCVIVGALEVVQSKQSPFANPSVMYGLEKKGPVSAVPLKSLNWKTRSVAVSLGVPIVHLVQVLLEVVPAESNAEKEYPDGGSTSIRLNTQPEVCVALTFTVTKEFPDGPLRR
jgi:hypothetical protein